MSFNYIIFYELLKTLSFSTIILMLILTKRENIQLF